MNCLPLMPRFVVLATLLLFSVAPLAAQDLDPLPEADGTKLSPQTLQYAATISTGGGMGLTLTHTLTEAEGPEGESLWRVVNETDAPMGATVDTFEVHRETLRPYRLHSSAAQGTLKLHYTEEQVTGHLDAGGQQIRIEEHLEGPVFSYGAGLELTIAALALDDDFEATLRFYDPQQQGVSTMKLTVEDTATTEVPAGTFDTWRLRLSPAEGEGNETVLYARREAPHYIIRSETSLPTGTGTETAVTELEEGL